MPLDWRSRYPAPTTFLPHRVTAPEYLDDPALPPAERSRSHADLDWIGGLPFQFGPLWRACRDLLRAARESDRPVHVLELGAGSGQAGRRMEEAARREGFRIRLTQTDRQPMHEGIVRLDWLLDSLPACEVAFANLVLHHFSREEATRALRRMYEAAAMGGVIYELNRSRLAFELLRWSFPFVVRSPVTVADGLISVQQAFTKEELEGMAREAGIPAAKVTRHGFVRLLLTWEKP